MMFIRHAQSEWNHHFSQTRVDPGIPDPSLTALGRQQAAGLIDEVARLGVTELMTSPYRRALETATILGEALDLPIRINLLVREHCFFSCDIGSHPKDLTALWPDIDFSLLEDGWWGEGPETSEAVAQRCALFKQDHADLLTRDNLAIVSHWGFIRAFTGQEVDNATIVHVDPGAAYSKD